MCLLMYLLMRAPAVCHAWHPDLADLLTTSSSSTLPPDDEPQAAAAPCHLMMNHKHPLAT
jgi:hypothetical protein